MASPGNPSGQHCASCIGTLSLQITRFFSLLFAVDGRVLAICRSGRQGAGVADECFMNAAPSASSVPANCILHLSLSALLLSCLLPPRAGLAECIRRNFWRNY